MGKYAAGGELKPPTTGRYKINHQIFYLDIIDLQHYSNKKYLIFLYVEISYCPLLTVAMGSLLVKLS
jgi:hypothetical protein